MNKINNEEEEQSGAVMAGRQIPCSPISARWSRANNGADDVVPPCVPRNVDSETPKADGVEENVSVLQSLLPPPGLEESKEKRNHKRTSQGNHATHANTLRRKGGSRLVRNKSLTARNGTNVRTCLTAL